MVEQDEPNKAGKGFAGLSSMVSNVDGVVKEASERVASQPAAPTTPSTPYEPSQNDRPEPYQQPSAGEAASAMKWLFWIIGGVVVFAWLASSDSKNNTSPPIPLANEQPASTSTPPVVIPTLEPVAQPVAVEEKPPVGTDMVLAANQIRYCVAESIRMGAAQLHVNDYNTSDIDRFNAMVADYNSRCSAFRYQHGNLERVRSEIEPNRVNLLLEGAARFPASNQQAPAQNQQQINETPTLDPQVQPQVPVPNGSDNTAVNAPTYPLTQDDRSSIESVCSTEKYLKGQDAYSRCTQTQLKALEGAPNPDIANLSQDDRSSIQSVCSGDKYTRGPAAYRSCVQSQVNALAVAPAQPDLSGLSTDENASLQSVCSSDKFTRGPTAYRRCLLQQLAALQSAPHPDTSALSPTEKQRIDLACSTDKFIRGPAAYDTCMAHQLAAIGH